MDVSNGTKKQVSRYLLLVTFLLLLIPFTLNSCSTDSYDSRITSRTTSVQITPETLKGWIDSGVVNSTGYDRVVILDIEGTQPAYEGGHIPGAQWLKQGDIYKTRQEGPATDVTLVLDGAGMDALIQKYGIDDKTTIVFTGSGSPLWASRAYFTFRYWGFPKAKLRVLDGLNATWDTLYGLTTEVPAAPVPSTYSVKSNAALRTDLRASLSEMIAVAEGTVPNAVPIDMRSGPYDGSYAGQRGKTGGVFSPTGDAVVWEGRPNGAKALLFSTLYDPSTLRIKSKTDIETLFAAIGIDSTKTSYVY